MEISTAAPATLSLPTNAKSPETDQVETPTTVRIQSSKSFPFTNGVLKRHHPSPASPPSPVIYKECMKNHAAALGGHALDGCGEFMPSASAITSDPTSLKCAACGCHRNFHRRETLTLTPSPLPLSAAPTATTHVIEYHPHHRHHPPPPQSPPPISSSYYPSSAPHMLLALSGGNSGGRKRFRSKFSQIQKEKMHEFAEKLGWKMQKASDEMVAGFCSDIGVERGVFKVWMHNNKNTFGKRDSNGSILPGIAVGASNPAAGTANPASVNDGSSGSGNGSHGYSKNGDGTYGSSTSS